ncbi:MAG: flagellin modification protein A [Odoribacter sp.]|nr:flagellin modification protein A [Odoribacter sp.]
MLKNKVIVITGGAGLLGQEFAKTVMENNGIAIIADFNQGKGIEVTENLQKLIPSATVKFQSLDINNKDSILSLIKKLNQKYGKIDALVNNAYPRNKYYGRKFEDVTYEDFCENLNLNLGGYFLTSQQFLTYFSQQGFGNIVNISSIYGVIAPRFEIYENTPMTMPVEYAAIKSALIHLTKYMAKYYKGKNIRVNSISLGGLFDNQPALFIEGYKSHSLNKGMLDKSDISGTLVYLLSDLSSFVNGQNVIVDDGFTL